MYWFKKCHQPFECCITSFVAHSWSIFSSTAASSGLYAKQSIRETHIYSQIIFLHLDCVFFFSQHHFNFPFTYSLSCICWCAICLLTPLNQNQNVQTSSDKSRKLFFLVCFDHWSIHQNGKHLMNSSIKWETTDTQSYTQWWYFFAEAKNVAPWTFSHFILLKPQNSNFFMLWLWQINLFGPC